MKIGRFRKWLIRKLGGQVYMTDYVVFHSENLQPVTLKYTKAIPSCSALTTKEIIDIIFDEAATSIGKQIIDDGLCRANFIFDPVFNVNKAVITVRILKPEEGE